MRTTYWLMIAVLSLGLGGIGCSKNSTQAEVQDKLSDSDLSTLVRSKLNDDPALAAADLSVSADAEENSVVLSGTLSSEALRAKAIELAQSARPGLYVTEQIELEPRELARSDYTQQDTRAEGSEAKEAESIGKSKEAGESIGKSMDDAWIHTKIAARLIGNSSTPARKIHVDVVKGTVTLSGTVATDEERREAERVASETDGVMRVIDNLKISPDQKKKQEGL